MMLVPGPAICLVYKLLANYYGYRFGFSEQVINLSIVVSSFSFTMLGFVATVVTLITVMEDRFHFKRYRKKGYLETFFHIYFITIGNLFATFVVSIFNFALHRPRILFDLMMALCINSLIQTFLVGAIIFNLLKHSYKDAAPGTDHVLGLGAEDSEGEDED